MNRAPEYRGETKLVEQIGLVSAESARNRALSRYAMASREGRDSGRLPQGSLWQAKAPLDNRLPLRWAAPVIVALSLILVGGVLVASAIGWPS